MEGEGQGRTLTLLFTDIEGSTRLLATLGEGYSSVRSDHLRLIRDALAAHDGVEIGTEGDAVFATFAEPPDGVSAALAAQLALRSHPWPREGEVRVRMGLHTGRVTTTSDGLVGMALHEAARVCSAAHGGQVLLSAVTAALSRIPAADWSIRDLGEHALKDLDGPTRLYQLAHSDLQSEFPPLRTTAGPAGQLPVQLTSFVGREKEVSEIDELLTENRLVTLTGAGGSGKTRLGLAVAEVERPKDGVWFVDLAAVPAGERVEDAVASVLGVRAETGVALTESLLKWVGPRELLLLLDNCEHVLDSSADLVERILREAPGVSVLATSREPLDLSNEVVWPTPPLLEATAEELFIDRAGRASPGFATDVDQGQLIREICKRLDGVPLAIELAAARAGTLPLAEIAKRLDDSVSLLARGRRGSLPRHQTIRAALDWSYDLLDPAERALFERLSVFPAGLALEAVEAVGSCAVVARADAIEMFTRLVGKSLIIRDGTGPDRGRYRMLEPVRQYARGRLGERGDTQDAAAAHARYWAAWAAVVETRVHKAGAGMHHRRVEAEQPSIRAALEWSLTEEPGASSALDIVAGVGQSWFVRGMQDETRDWLRQAVELTNGDRDERRGHILVSAALGAMSDARLDDVAALCEKAAALASELGLDDIRGEAFELWSIAAWGRGDLDRADTICGESCGTNTRAYWYPGSLAQWARVAKDRGQIDLAEERVGEAVRLAEAAGEDHMIGWTMDVAADVALARGDIGLATERAEGSLTHYREVGYEEGVASALNRMGDIAVRRELWDDARDAYGQAELVAGRIGHRGARAAALEGIAAACEGLDQRERAVELIAAADALRSEAGLALPPVARAQVDARTARLRAAVGEDFDGLWQRGQAHPESVTISLDA